MVAVDGCGKSSGLGIPSILWGGEMKSNIRARHPSEWFSSDRPIETRDEDVLGRRGFSESLADAIRGWSGRESLVLALYGEWGDGKSSIKNMVVEALHSKSPNIDVVDFNP